jgi:hypothetical protein
MDTVTRIMILRALILIRIVKLQIMRMTQSCNRMFLVKHIRLKSLASHQLPHSPRLMTKKQVKILTQKSESTTLDSRYLPKHQ